MRDYFVLAYDEAAHPCGISEFWPLDFDPTDLWCSDVDYEEAPSLPLMRLSTTACKLTDIVPNPLSFLIVSQRLRAMIQKVCPLAKPHDARLIDDHDRWIVGFSTIFGLPQIDCLDETRSEGLRDEAGSIRTIFSPWIDETRVPTEVSIFRVKGMPGATYVDRRFAAALRRARITGVALVATAGANPMGER